MPSLQPPAARMRFQLGAFTFTRTVLNTAFRMVYPFLPVFARGLGVDLPTIALAVTARSSVGLASPILGSIADAGGRKATMLLGLVLFSVGASLVAIWPLFPVLVVSMVLATLGKVLFDPTMQAYLGEHIHYSRRGLAWGPARRLGYRRPRMDGTVPVAGRARVGSCRTTVGGTAGGRAPSSTKFFVGGRTELDPSQPFGHGRIDFR